MEVEGGDVVAYYNGIVNVQNELNIDIAYYNGIVNVQNELNIDIVSSMLECAYYLKCDLTKRVAPSIYNKHSGCLIYPIIAPHCFRNSPFLQQPLCTVPIPPAHPITSYNPGM